MHSTYEVIEHSAALPLRVFLHEVRYVQYHWHDALEVLFLLDGEVTIGVGGRTHQLAADDFLVINPNEPHTVSSKKSNVVLALQIFPKELLGNGSWDAVRVQCSSALGVDDTVARQLRNLLARLTLVMSDKAPGFELLSRSLLLRILHLLFTHFQTADPTALPPESQRQILRISNIVQLLQEHFTEDITLDFVAEKESLSPTYLSRFFTKYIGISFKGYLNRLRLEHAVEAMCETKAPLVDIALNSGFPNVKSFWAAFKAVYGELPSTFRKREHPSGLLIQRGVRPQNYTEVPAGDLFSHLYKHLEASEPPFGAVAAQVCAGPFDVSVPGQLLEHTWKTLVSIGKASDGLRPDLQAQIRQARTDVGFRYLGFHGLFDDDMGVYGEDAGGRPVLDFRRVDELFDFLLGVGLRPYCEFSFMPRALAAEVRTVFRNQSVVSLPKDPEKWRHLVQGFLGHCIERYSLDEVAAWFFEVWNEPDLEGVFWHGTQNEYLEFFAATFRAVKAVSPRLRVAGPAISNSVDASAWLERFLDYCRDEAVLPDVASFHFYPLGELPGPGNPFAVIDTTRFLAWSDPDSLARYLAALQGQLEPFGYGPSRLVLGEWSCHPSHRYQKHDTQETAAYLVRNLCDNLDKAAAFGWWTVSDILEEYPEPEISYHGGMGLFTAAGVKKAAYHGFALMARLGDRLVAQGKGYCLTRSDSGFQALLYNEKGDDLSLEVTLTGLPADSYKVTERLSDRSQGDSYELWRAMGSPEPPNAEETDYLRRVAVPRYSSRVEAVTGTYPIRRVLGPYAVLLVELAKLE